jgi:bifunctional DNA-binding transcriptional regulator/antitoxin component of YhaV-PrlF toxin-antitoxin module
MKKATITRSGQMSIPASIRHRWETRQVLVDDRGDHFVVRPAPEDPIAAFRGSLQGRGPSIRAARQLAREEEREREQARAKKQRGRTR